MPTPTPQPPLGIALGGPSNCLPLPESSDTGHQIGLRHLRQLANAEAFAAAQGTPLTAHCTIHLRLAEGFTPERWPSFQTRLLDKASRWLRRHGVPVAFAWVRESGPAKGPHLHLLLHLPFPMWGRFKTFLLHAGRFTVSDAGGEAIVITGGRFGMFAPSMRSGLLKYVSKSAPPATCDALGIRHRPTLPVAIKRCGVSHTISQQARALAGWTEMRTVEELHAHLHPDAAANDNQPGEVAHVAA